MQWNDGFPTEVGVYKIRHFDQLYDRFWPEEGQAHYSFWNGDFWGATTSEIEKAISMKDNRSSTCYSFKTEWSPIEGVIVGIAAPKTTVKRVRKIGGRPFSGPVSQTTFEKLEDRCTITLVEPPREVVLATPCPNALTVAPMPSQFGRPGVHWGA
jgi:hypothetical protein